MGKIIYGNISQTGGPQSTHLWKAKQKMGAAKREVELHGADKK